MDARTEFERNKWTQVNARIVNDSGLFPEELKPEATIIYAQILVWERIEKAG